MWNACLLALALLTPAPDSTDIASADAAEPGAPRGAYVEARTAAVYAGACHFGAQYTTQGRGAVLAWSFTGGRFAGEDLTGIELVSLVNADRNLAEPKAERTSVIWLDRGLESSRRDAALAWLSATHASTLGRIVEVRAGDVRVRTTKDSYHVSVDELIRMRGKALPERDCCKMPYNVLYDPFVPVRSRLVGHADEFRVDVKKLRRSWDRAHENNAFFGVFGPKSQEPEASLAGAR